MQTNLTMESFIGKRIMAWIMERFPPVHWVLGLIIFLLPYSWQNSGFSSFDLSAALSAISTVCYFLIFRVLDEHKDYELDCKNHPQRVLQRGFISLTHLKIVGLVALSIVSTWTFLNYRPGYPMLPISFGALIVWTFLMTKEFFVKEYLEKRLLLYGFSHMLVMIPLGVWLFSLSDPSMSELNGDHWCVVAMIFLTGSIAEVSRKFKAADEEVEGIDSYTKSLGVNKASALLCLLDGLFLFCSYFLLFNSGLNIVSVVAMLAIGAFFLISIRSVIQFSRAKKLEGIHGGFILIVYIVSLITIALGS